MKVLKIVLLVVFISLGCLLSGCGETETDKHFRQRYEYYWQGEYEQAISELQKVIEIDPNYLDAHVGLGLVYRQQSKLDDAITKYQQILQIEPDYAMSHLGLGGIYYIQRKYEQAITK